MPAVAGGRRDGQGEALQASPPSAAPSWPWAVFPLLFVAGSAVVGLATRPDAWYAGLAKSALTPPGWVFGTVWPCLYALMGAALAWVWVQPRGRLRSRAIALFFVQLAINYPWNFVFFDARLLLVAFLWILVLLVAALAAIWAFFRVKRAAAIPLLPYIAWLSFAAYLSGTIWFLNA